MNVWIDINHIPQWNFYKPLVETVTRKGHSVWQTVLDRGKLAKIMRRETEQLAHVQVDIIGRHRMTKWSAIVEAALLGVPSYYPGIRYSMPANAAASKVASLQNQRTMPFEEWIKEIGDAGTTAEQRTEQQDALRARIDAEFIDINAYMLALVENNK